MTIIPCVRERTKHEVRWAAAISKPHFSRMAQGKLSLIEELNFDGKHTYLYSLGLSIDDQEYRDLVTRTIKRSYQQ